MVTNLWTKTSKVEIDHGLGSQVENVRLGEASDRGSGGHRAGRSELVFKKTSKNPLDKPSYRKMGPGRSNDGS